MTLSNLMFLYGDSIAYHVILRLPLQKQIDVGCYNFYELNQYPEFLARDVLYHSNADKGVMTAVVA